MPDTWIVKCDDCKRTIRTTNELRESYEGGVCDECARHWERDRAAEIAGDLAQEKPH